MNKSLQLLRVTVLNIGHVDLTKQWDHDNVISPFTRLYLIKSGKAKMYHHDQVFDLKPGYLYLVPSFTYSRYKCDHKMEQIYIHFLEEIGSGLSIYSLCNFLYQVKASVLSKELFERLLQLNPGRKLIEDDPKVYDNRPTLKTFEEKNNNLSAAHYVETNSIVQFLLAQFIDNANSILNPTNYKANRIIEILHYISENLQNEIKVEHLAARCHVNTDYFSRLFKDQTGSGPLQYLQNMRIERAQILLTTTNHTMQEIADMVGLSNISYFNRLFTRLTNKTPGTYRKENWSV